MDPIYIFLAIRADGSSPALEFVACENDRAATARLNEWLEGHDSCIAAQAWRDGVLVSDMRREAASRRSHASEVEP